MNRTPILFLVLALASLAGCATAVCNTTTTTTVLVTKNTAATCAARGKSYECGSLQSALDFVATSDQSCIVVQVLSGVYTLIQNVTITKNVTIRGSRGTKVTFNFSSDLIASVRQIAVLSLKNSHQVNIENIAFENSPGFIEIVNVTSIYLTNSAFRFFIQGAVNVYNFHNIIVDKCVFEHNGPASNIKFKDIMRGHCGGLSISQHKYPLYQDHVVIIKNTMFSNNSALPTNVARQSTTDTYRESVFTGKGGGLGLFLGDQLSTIDVEVTNCSLLSNVALSYGGGLYVLTGTKANHSVLIQDCLFWRNQCLFSAGALFISFRDPGTRAIHSSVITRNVVCKENVARQAGCMHVFSPGHQKLTVYNFLQVENCTFIGNIAYEYAAAISLNTIDMINQLEYSNPTKIIDCKFISNSSPRSGTVGIAFVPIIFQGVNNFYQNTGEAMQIAGSLVHFYGHLDFVDQRTVGSPDGTLSVTSLGQVVLHKGAHISFINNTGVVGSAISVESQKISDVFSKLLFNPLCFLRYEDLRKAPDSWEDVEIYFSGNSAVEAPVAVIYLLNLCSWVSTSEPFFNPVMVLKWKFVKFGENRNLFHLDNSSSEFFIRSHAVTLDIGNQTIDTYPGEVFGLNVSIKDEFKKTIGATIRFEANILPNSNEVTKFKPAASVHHREDEILRKKLVLLSKNHTNAINTYTATASTFFSTAMVHGTTGVNVRQCPPGFILSRVKGSADSSLCRCNSDNDPAILTCGKNRVILNGNLWASEDRKYSSDALFVFNCPAGYCRCELNVDSVCIHSFQNEQPDEQCACGRKGVLCGECSNSSFGVSALLNRCVTCHDAMGLLVALLIISDVTIVIIVLKIFTGRKYPAWIYSCLFYVQALPHITEHFKEGFGLFRQFLYFISSATSLYFPYDLCLYSNMSALVSYSLRFIPSVLAASITSMYLTISWNFRRHRANWHAVWLLLILIYTQTVHTSLSILYCPTVHFNDTHSRRWFVAGHVTCFTGSHTGLAVVAVFMLVLCVLAIVVSFILSLYHTERIVWLKRLSRAVRYPFKHQYRWWYSVELARRFLIVLMTVLFPQNNFPSLLFQCVSMVIFLYTQPYISTAANVVEAILSISTVFMLLESLCNFEIRVPIVLRAKCTDENSIITLNTLLRAVPFYIPLVVTVGLTILSTLRIIRKKQEGSSHQKPDEQLMSTPVPLVRNPLSTTYIDVHQSKSMQFSELSQLEESTTRNEPVTPLVEKTEL